MQQRQRRSYTIFGIVMAILMAVTLFLPGLAPQQPVTAPQTEPTAVPIPTFPPPIQDVNTVAISDEFLHPSGLYTVGVPEGWTPSAPSNNGTQVQINFENNDALSVIETYVEIPQQPIETLEDLSNHFNQVQLQAGWRRYSSWDETGRFLNEDTEEVIIDFELEQNRQTYLARHTARVEDDWIYVTRVVTPQNARDLLLYLIGVVPPTMERNELYVGTPIAWSSYYSPEDGFILRYPNGWRIADGEPGFPVSIEGGQGERMRIETRPETPIADEAAAEAFVQALQPGAEIVSVAPVERDNASGYTVAYQQRTLDGEAQSGVALLLVDANDTLYLSNARVPVADVDFNNPDAENTATSVTNITTLLETFYLTAGLDLPVDEEEVTEEPADPAGDEEEAATTEDEDAASDDEADDTADDATADEDTASDEETDSDENTEAGDEAGTDTDSSEEGGDNTDSEDDDS